MESKDIDGDLMHKVFGKIIQDGRIKKGLTQGQLEELIDVGQKYVSKIETGARGFAPPKLVRCMEVLEITPNIFYKPFLHNERLKKELEISEAINGLSEEQLDFVMKMIKDIKNLK